VSFRTRLFGFDREEVRTFVASLLEDRRTVPGSSERFHDHEPLSIRTGEPPASEPAAREVQRVLESVHRVADDIERRASAESAALIAEAQANAAAILAAARSEAEQITTEARREADRLEAQTAVLRAHCLKLRTAFEAAADTAGTALSEIAAAHADPELHLGETADASSRS
jgi:cell division septum initiation protein DivIVA